MPNKYKNKYRISSARAPFWDYGRVASYFVTICTKNRKHFFGRVENKKMILSDIGEIVNSEWLKSFEMRLDMNLSMGQYVVMPNHFHAIITIGINRYNTPGMIEMDGDDVGGDGGDGVDGGDDDGDDDDDGGDVGRDAMHCVSTDERPNTDERPHTDADSNPNPSNKNTDNKPINKFGPQYKNLSSIIRGFKIGVTTHSRRIRSEFGWQARFHDHIIRDSGEYRRISNYIKYNPANWKGDRFYE